VFEDGKQGAFVGSKESRPEKVELLSTEQLAGGHVRLEKLTLRTETFAGGWSAVMERDVVRTGTAVVILLFDPRSRQLILIDQFRLGALLNHLPSYWLLECAAGKVDEGEDAEQAARREAVEETGCTVQRIEKVGAYLSTPGICDELVTIYVGEVDASRAGGVHGEEEEHEDIRTVLLSVEDGLDLLDQGKIINAMTQIALLWFARHGEALAQRWLA
jgi:ADP-ribose pyrophosphatase